MFGFIFGIIILMIGIIIFASMLSHKKEVREKDASGTKTVTTARPARRYAWIPLFICGMIAFLCFFACCTVSIDLRASLTSIAKHG